MSRDFDHRPPERPVSNTELMSMIAWFEGEQQPSPERITRLHLARALRELQERRDAEQLRGLHQPVLDERGKPTGYYRDLKTGEIVTLKATMTDRSARSIPPAKDSMLARWWKRLLCRHHWDPVYHSYHCEKCGAWSYD